MRLDCFLLTFGCLSQVIKYLDQTNISNAYVSGMKEDLSLCGNELNYFTTWFSVGYCIFLIPSQIIITHVRPSWWLPGLELIWGILTGCLALAQNAKTIYAIRTFIGVCESSAYPGTVTLLMSWYTPLELAKRVSFYHSCQAIGSMISGVLQAAIIRTMSESHIAEWRWLFIINCIMTVCLAIFGVVMLPDFPSSPNPWALWLKPRHAELALERSRRHGRAKNKKFTWQTVQRLAHNRAHIALAVALPAMYVSTLLASSSSSYFTLFLKSLKNDDGTAVWPTASVNLIPTGGSAINIFVVWTTGYLSDHFQLRWPLIVGAATVGLIPSIIMSVWNVPLGAKYFSYFIIYALQATTPPIFTWMSDLIPHDAELRALIMGIAIAFYYVFTAWVGPLQWPASEAPHYSHGWQICLALWLLVISLVGFIYWLAETHIKPYNIQEAIRRADEYADPVPAAGKDEEEAPIDDKKSDLSGSATAAVSVLPVASR